MCIGKSSLSLAIPNIDFFISKELTSSSLINFLANHLAVTDFRSLLSTFSGLWTFPYVEVPRDMRTYFRGLYVEERLVNTALKRPDWFWGPLSLLFIGYGGVLSAIVKRQGREAGHALLSNAEVTSQLLDFSSNRAQRLQSYFNNTLYFCLDVHFLSSWHSLFELLREIFVAENSEILLFRHQEWRKLSAGRDKAERLVIGPGQ
jgi:hypothetical protein